MSSFSFTFASYSTLSRGNKVASEVIEAEGCTWQVEFFPFGTGTAYCQQVINLIHKGKKTRVTIKCSVAQTINGVEKTTQWEGTSNFNGKSVKLPVGISTYQYYVTDLITIDIELREEESSESSLEKDLALMWKDVEDTHDFEIRVDDHVIPVHKLMLMRSPVLKAMLKANMQEATTNSMIVSDFNAKTVTSFVYFLYHDQLPKKVDVEELLTLLQMSMMYQVKALAKACETSIEKQLNCANCFDRLIFAHTYSCNHLKDGVFKFIVRHRKDLSKKLTEDVFESLGTKLSYELLQQLMK